MTKRGRQIPFEESERVRRVRRIMREVFKTDQAVTAWLKTPDQHLGSRTPLELLATEDGEAKVKNLALAIVHGIPL